MKDIGNAMIKCCLRFRTEAFILLSLFFKCNVEFSSAISALQWACDCTQLKINQTINENYEWKRYSGLH